MYICIHAQRAQYTSGSIDTLISEVTIDTATTGGEGRAIFVEQCMCPRGYAGISCEVIKWLANAKNAIAYVFEDRIFKIMLL